jgi:hypothetical protein
MCLILPRAANKTTPHFQPYILAQGRESFLQADRCPALWILLSPRESERNVAGHGIMINHVRAHHDNDACSCGVGFEAHFMKTCEFKTVEDFFDEIKY